MSVTLSLIILLGIALITGSLIFWTLRLGIGPTPSSAKVMAALSDILPDSVQGDVVELGCGWGQLLPLLQKQYPQNRLIAYERSPVPFYFCRCFFPRTTIHKKDFFQTDLSGAGLIICYLYPGAMTRLSKEIMPQLPDHCLILTHTFSLPDAPLVRTLKANDLYKTPIFLFSKGKNNNAGKSRH